MSCELQGVEWSLILPRKLRDRKINFRSFIYGQSSTNPKKIGPVDIEIFGLTEITKIFLNKKQQ